ncbi:MAG TPA: DUF5305 family protein, partial [Thermoplasmata archaeon]|nr:DUF5305 family protein [Thermoplasmata archaeon]
RNTVFITEPSFNLTLVNSQYFAPTNFTSPFAQSINLTSKSADPTASFYRTASDSVLAALLLALAGVGYLVWRPERTPSGPVDEEAQVEAMTAPYQDAISSTLSLPHRENVVILREWDDLVHSADMLSKPILHLESRVEDRTRHIFYLVDGAVQYVYLHHVLPPPAADPHPWRSRLRELFGGPTSTVSSASRRRRPPPHGPPPIDEWSPPRAESGTRNGSGRAPGRPDEVPPGARR